MLFMYIIGHLLWTITKISKRSHQSYTKNDHGYLHCSEDMLQGRTKLAQIRFKFHHIRRPMTTIIINIEEYTNKIVNIPTNQKKILGKCGNNSSKLNNKLCCHVFYLQGKCALLPEDTNNCAFYLPQALFYYTEF